MQVVVNFFIKVIGAETTFLLAIVIAAYGIYGKFGASSAVSYTHLTLPTNREV